MKIQIVVILAFILSFGACEHSNQNGAIIASGTMEATEVTLSSKVAGDIVALKVRDGSSVKKGEQLLQIDTTDLELQRAQVTAQVDLADARLRMVVKGAREEDKQQVRKKVEAAQASLDQAKADFQRIEVLRTKGSATQKQFDDVRSLLDVRQAHYEGAQQALNKVLKGARSEEIDIARATKAQAVAQLAIIDKKIQDGTILAPVSGTITEKLVEVGETVMPGQDVLTLADLSMVKLRVYVKEEVLPLLRLNQEVEVRIDGSEQPLQGQVRYISDVAEFTPKTIQTQEERVKLVFAVEIELANKAGMLKAGMPADAYFPGS